VESSCSWCVFRGELILGNWDQYSDLGDEEKSADILLEWKWNQGLQEIASLTLGLPRDVAQEQFICEAEEMGITPVRWHVDDQPILVSLADVVSPKLITDGRETVKRLFSRSMLPYPETQRNDRSPLTLGTVPLTSDVKSTGPGLLANLGLRFWMLLQYWDGNGKVDRKSSQRLHVRSWNNAGDRDATCTRAVY
jgi:hypothetical protein